jgi:hypothetical protein
VFDEAVLYRPFGGQKTMHEQLESILEMAACPRTFVQVVRYSSVNHPGVEGPLRVLFYPDAPPLAYTESRYTGRTSGTDADDAATNFDLIRGAAMSSADSIEFICTVKEEIHGTE